MLNQHEAEEFAAKSAWVLDVDDCLYDIDDGLHDFIQGNITTTFNNLVSGTAFGQDVVARFEQLIIGQGVSVVDPRHIERTDLSVAFPLIVRAIQDAAPTQFDECMAAFYGDRYDLIEPEPKLVDAFRQAQAKGVAIFFYTNGPSGNKPGSHLHLQKVLQRRGFDSAFIELSRARAYDLQMSVRAGRGKPTPKGMRDFLDYSGIDPHDALMADDQIKNLKTAHDAGLKSLWTWTTNRVPPAADTDIACGIGAVRVRHTADTLHQIATARLNSPALKRTG
jgi:FMN phosphatase YigB (HAD superfamily)